MCLDCGCERPDDDHGDPRHITAADIRAAAEAAGIEPDQVVHNILSGWKLRSIAELTGESETATTA